MIRAAEMILGFYQRDEEDGDKEENTPVLNSAPTSLIIKQD